MSRRHQQSEPLPAGAAGGRRRRKTGRRIGFFRPIAAGALLGVAWIVTGLTVNPVPSELMSIFGGGVADSDLSVQEIDHKPKGKNRVDVTVTMQNADASNAHGADVTVQLLDAAGDLLLEDTQASGSVGASATSQMAYSFNQADIVTAYSSVMVVIEQTT